MFNKPIKLFKVLGFEVKLDFSWFIIAFLIVWTLADGAFPYFYPGLTQSTYWWMGILGAIGLFISIIFHELCHSIVARKFGMPMKGITLFVFGGVAEMEDEPTSAKAEFFMSLIGPLSSIALGSLFQVVFYLSKVNSFPEWAIGVSAYLRVINFVLAGFNLLPAFPLDGGRIFRSILWKIKGDMQWATRIAVNVGSVFGFLLSFLGVLYIFMGNFVGGMWWILIGMFLRNAAQMSYQRLVMRQFLVGEKVRHFMKSGPMTAPASISIKEFVEDYVFRHHYKMFPVLKEGVLLGSVSTREVKNIPREQWGVKKVEDLITPCSSENTVSPDTDAAKALAIMNQKGISRLMVAENGKLIGIITLKDMLRFFSLKMDLGGERF